MDGPICRLCLSNTRSFLDIFKDSKAFKKIQRCTNLKIVAGDGLPSFVCNKCIKKLNSAYRFRRTCEQSDKILKKLSQSVESYSAVSKISTININLYGSEDNKIYNFDESVQNDIYFTNKNQKESLLVSDISPLIVNCNDSNANCINRDCNTFAKEKISTKNKARQCNECGKLYKSQGYLANHMKIHKNRDKLDNEHHINEDYVRTNKNILQKKFICSFCGKHFSQASNLMVHNRSHTGEKPFQCDVCFKAFTQVGNLYVHKRIHTNIRKYKCKNCLMDFKLLSHLEEHMKTHSNNKEYHCRTCGKGFHKSSHLWTHIRTHTGEKPFNCEHCGKFFSDSSNLTTHIRIHTGNKPFTCKYCKKGFAQKISMIRHEKQHSKKQLDNISKNTVEPSKPSSQDLQSCLTSS